LKHIKLSISLYLLICTSVLAASKADILILRQNVIANGFVPAKDLYQNPHPELINVGKKIFESPHLSLNAGISCRTCHIDKFGSADGIPNAAAIFDRRVSQDELKLSGPDRLMNHTKLLPRNTLAFWGRGAKNFDAFFWDGKISVEDKKIISQFGSRVPSKDLLVSAAHLPVVEIREFIDEDDYVQAHKEESVKVAQKVYKKIAQNLTEGEPESSKIIANYFHKNQKDLTYTDYAEAIAAFIRSDFKLKETKLERFAYQGKNLSDNEIKGGLIFYGTGKCVTCHSGPHFSDFKYHAVAFPELGFGRNGFGIDYGRYNATFNTNDLYKFRTAPLFNVEKTAPYGHSGSVADIESSIYAHFDPLRLVDLSKMTPLQRNDFYKRLTFSKETVDKIGFMSDEDVKNVAEFLKTLTF
jgi:cytochrome c peroxidase